MKSGLHAGIVFAGRAAFGLYRHALMYSLYFTQYVQREKRMLLRLLEDLHLR